MTRVIVLGAGVMGTAFALPLSDNGMSVALVGTHLDRHLIEGMRASRTHGRLKARIGDGIVPFQDHEIADAFAEAADLIVVGVSTPGVAYAIDRLADHMKGSPPILLLTKGIGEVPDRLQVLPDTFARGLAERGVRHGPIGGVGGPCIAGELAVRRPTEAVAGFRDAGLAADLAGRIATSYYRLEPTDDLVGLEVCAALKNFYAIGVSVAAGQAETASAENGAAMHNATAALFTEAVRELSEIVAVAGGRSATAFGLPGLGDLHVTCQAGRNSKLGRLIGAGLSFDVAMGGPLAGETVEGILVAQSMDRPLAAYEASGRLVPGRVRLAHAIIGMINRGLTASAVLR